MAGKDHVVAGSVRNRVQGRYGQSAAARPWPPPCTVGRRKPGGSPPEPPEPAAAELEEARRRRREAALALRPEMSPVGPAPGQFRVATWNVNSLKARTPAPASVPGAGGAGRRPVAGDQGSNHQAAVVRTVAPAGCRRSRCGGAGAPRRRRARTEASPWVPASAAARSMTSRSLVVLRRRGNRLCVTESVAVDDAFGDTAC